MIPLIPRPLHALMDYLWGIVHALAPELMGFQDDEGANAYCKARGGGAVVTSLMTRYELGVIRVIPYNMHLLLDLLSALSFGLLGPQLFGFSKNKKATQVAMLFTAIEIATVLTSKRDRK